MSFIDEFTDWMNHECTIHQFGTHGKDGRPLPGADLVVKGYVEGKVMKVITDQKTEAVTSSILYLDRVLDVHPESTVTIPVGFTPRQRLKILKIDQYTDESELTCTVLYLGR